MLPSINRPWMSTTTWGPEPYSRYEMRRPRWTKSETTAGQAVCALTAAIVTVLLRRCAEGRALPRSGRAGPRVRPLLLPCPRLDPRLGRRPVLQPLDVRGGLAPPRQRRGARPLLRRGLVGAALRRPSSRAGVLREPDPPRAGALAAAKDFRQRRAGAGRGRGGLGAGGV